MHTQGLHLSEGSHTYIKDTYSDVKSKLELVGSG